MNIKEWISKTNNKSPYLKYAKNYLKKDEVLLFLTLSSNITA